MARYLQHNSRFLRDGADMMDLVEDVLMPILVFICVGFLLFLVIIIPFAAMFGGPTKQQEMYQHCIDDGNKDYVCYQMTHTQTQTDVVTVPMVIPMRVK